MDSQKFLEKLIAALSKDNTEISIIGFDNIDNYFLKQLDYFKKNKQLICISASSFDENLDSIVNLEKINCLEAIISLPIFKIDDNLLILIFNSMKTNNKCLFIDESDSLLHKTDSVDWTYASEELIEKITRNYNDFKESDTSIILNIEDIFPNTPQDNELYTFESDSDELPSKKDEVIQELLELKSDKTDFPVRKNKIISSDLAEELISLKSDKTDFPVRKNKIIADDLADELLSLKQQKSVRDEIAKHDTKEEASHVNLPFLNDVMYFKKRQNPENLLYKDDKRLIDGEVQFRKLGKIADLHNIYVKNDLNSILIATCKGCTSKLVYYNKDITDFKGEVYIELINITNTVSIDYLYEYLNSSNGLDELLYFSKGNNFITPQDIKNVKIPIPPLEIQKEIVKVARESREFFKTIELLKKEFNSNILDYKHMQKSLNEFKGEIEFNSDTNEITELSRNWRHAYKGLIWPLAISYLSATKGGFESVEKKDNYLVLFEFIAAFNSIVLLSGLPDDVYQRNFSRIWNSRNPNEYKQMTFANWVYLSKNLAEVYKFNNFTSTLDEELFDKITEDKLLNILEDAKNLRNDESHGSHSNAYEAEQVIEILNGYLDDIFDILDVYANYKLIYVTGDIKSAKQAYNHRVILLNGPCAQPIYDNIIFDTVLQGDSLYLYNPKNNKKLLLKDNLIKFSPIDDFKRRWALFIYYSCDKNEYNAFYRCFQSNEKDVKMSISSLKNDILGKNF